MTSRPDRYPEFHAELEQLKSKDQFRSLRPIEKREGKYVFLNGRPLINLSSNDYLGLAADPALHYQFFSHINKNNVINHFGLGASASRLLAGSHSPYAALEETIATLYQREAALVFNSGYHANLGILSSLLGRKDIIFSDRLNHASLLDGARLSGAKLYRYRHLDYNHLEKLLSQHRGNFQRAIILSESIFSMDGDLVDLTKLVEVKKRHDAWLYIDEAHALGVRGPQGLGLCEEQNLIPQIDLILATFGKALASLGAFVAGDRVIINYLVNKMRPFIFTTALPPIIVCWNLQLLQQLPEFKEQRIHLRQLALRLRTAFQEAGLSTLGDSQIVPLIIGESHRAITVAEKLKENGFLLFPIRPPTVPVNTSRLRISLTANLEWDDVKDLPGIAAQALQEGKDTP